MPVRANKYTISKKTPRTAKSTIAKAATRLGKWVRTDGYEIGKAVAIAAAKKALIAALV